MEPGKIGISGRAARWRVRKSFKCRALPTSRTWSRTLVIARFLTRSVFAGTTKSDATCSPSCIKRIGCSGIFEDDGGFAHEHRYGIFVVHRLLACPRRARLLGGDMSEELDKEVLACLAYLIQEEPGEVETVQRLWKDRGALVDAMRAIVNWDLMSAEAFSIERARQI